MKIKIRIPVAKRGVMPHKSKKSYQRKAKHPRKYEGVSLF